MSKVIEQTGKTTAEAIERALAELGVGRDAVKVEILQEAETGGLLGLGRKEALVRVALLGSDQAETDGAPDLAEAGAADAAAETGPVADDIKGADIADQMSADEEDAVYYGDDIDTGLSVEVTREEEAACDFLTRVLRFFDLDGRVQTAWEEDRLLIEVDGGESGVIIGHRGETMQALQALTSVAVNRVSDRHVHVVLDVSGYRRRRHESLERMAKRYAKEVKRRQAEFVMEPMPASDRRVIHFALQNYAGVTTESEGVEPNRCVVIIPTDE